MQILILKYLKYVAGAFAATATFISLNEFNRNNNIIKNIDYQQKLTVQKANDKFYEDVMLFSGNGNIKLAQEIAENLKTRLGNIEVSRFTDGEINIRVKENIRGKDIYIIQPTCTPVNENLMELLLMISTFRRAAAGKINVVIPYYGYSRQDRKMAPRVPISAADVAKLIVAMGVDRLLSIDLHCGQIQGFFPPRVPVDNLEASIVALDHFCKNEAEYGFDNPVIVSPDAGGVTRAKKFQELFQLSHPAQKPSLAMIIKHREMPGKIAQMYLVGEVKDKDAIIIDDMIDTGGTLCHAADELKSKGAKRVFAFATHGLFNGTAFDVINKSSIEKIIVTNTTPQKDQEVGNAKIVRLSVAPLLAESIRRIQQRESVSSLFEI